MIELQGGWKGHMRAQVVAKHFWQIGLPAKLWSFGRWWNSEVLLFPLCFQVALVVSSFKESFILYRFSIKYILRLYSLIYEFMTYDLSPLSFRSAFTCTTFEQQLTDSGAEAEPSTQKAWCLRARPRATAAKLRLLQLWKCTQMFRRSLWQLKASILICAIWATWGRRLGTVKFPWLQSTAKQSTRQIHYQEPENQSPDGCLLGCHWRSFLICFAGVTAERAPVMFLVFRIRMRSSLWEFAHLDQKRNDVMTWIIMNPIFHWSGMIIHDLATVGCVPRRPQPQVHDDLGQLKWKKWCKLEKLDWRLLHMQRYFAHWDFYHIFLELVALFLFWRQFLIFSIFNLLFNFISSAESM